MRITPRKRRARILDLSAVIAKHLPFVLKARSFILNLEPGASETAALIGGGSVHQVSGAQRAIRHG
jgi:hypothetical protein